MITLHKKEIKYYGIFLGKFTGLLCGLGIGFILLSIPLWSVIGNTVFWGLWVFTPMYGLMIIIGWVWFHLKEDDLP